MIRILLIRHGHTELLGKMLYGRMPGVHLSEKGRQEAARLADVLGGQYRINEVVASPMERARETAEPIAARAGATLLFDDGVQELDFGEWMGRPFADLLADELWKHYNRHRSLGRPPGGEFLMEVQCRAWRTLERVITRNDKRPEATIAVVTHGDVVRALLMLFLGMPLDHIHRLEISTASVSEVIVSGLYPQVVTVNQTF